jgi:hypothetical protein
VVRLNEIWQNSISLSQDWTGAEISNIVDNEMVPIRTSVIAGNFLLLLLYLRCKAYQRCITFGCLIHLLVQGHQFPLLYFLES